MGGGTLCAISTMTSSGMGPGPLGMAPTSPRALAPRRIANRASSRFMMQQTLMRGCRTGSMDQTPPIFTDVMEIEDGQRVMGYPP